MERDIFIIKNRPSKKEAMKSSKAGDQEIEIDESSHVSVLTLRDRIKNAAIAVVMGIVLVQVYFFWGAANSGSFVPASVVIYFDSIYFIGYLVICGILGWFQGKKFIDWLNVKISFWKFW